MHHQAGVHFENFTEVKFRDIFLTGTGHRDRRLNWDSPGQTGTYGGSSYNKPSHFALLLGCDPRYLSDLMTHFHNDFLVSLTSQA